jgi:hypothetical protein
MSAAAESGSVFSLVLLYIWWIRPFFPRFWVLLLAAVLISHVLRRETPEQLGFRTGGFRTCVARYGPYVAGAVAALVAIGAGFHSIHPITFNWAAINFSLYLAWGLFQQYVLNGYFVNRFVRFTRRAPLLAAVIFAAAHAPNWFLMAATGVGGYCAARVYLRYRNLYFLGLAHGVLGFALYMVVADRISHHLYIGPKWFSL